MIVDVASFQSPPTPPPTPPPPSCSLRLDFFMTPVVFFLFHFRCVLFGRFFYFVCWFSLSLHFPVLLVLLVLLVVDIFTAGFRNPHR